MIWFSAESASMWTRPSACGPIVMPVTRNTATSGIRIFCATRLARVPIARIRPHDSSVCFAISMEADASKLVPRFGIASSRIALVQRLQPACNVGCRDVGLRQQLAHGEEAVELAGKVPVGYGHSGGLQPRGVFVAFVARGIAAGGHHIGRRQSGERPGARG